MRLCAVLAEALALADAQGDTLVAAMLVEVMQAARCPEPV